jgi:hypothetical protein
MVGRFAGAAALLLSLLSLVAGCNDSKPYHDLAQKNLQIRTTAGGARMTLEVHSLGDSCTRKYEGFVSLDQPLVELGLPPDKPSLLVFEFQRTGVLSSDAPVKKEVQMLPRTGQRYELRVAYKDPIHDIELREIDLRTGADREIDTRRRC